MYDINHIEYCHECMKDGGGGCDGCVHDKVKLKDFYFQYSKEYCIGCAGGWICYGSGSGVLSELKNTSGKLNGCRLGKPNPVPFQDRAIKEVYEKADGTIAIIIEGAEVGRFWTREEYRKFNDEPVKEDKLNFEDLGETELKEIVMQIANFAAKDYRTTIKAIKSCRNPKACSAKCAFRKKLQKSCLDSKAEIEKFFKGPIFGEAFPSVDGERCLQILEEQ